MPEKRESQKRIESIDGFVQKLHAVPDPDVQRLLRELVQSLMDFHGSAIERMLEILGSGEEQGRHFIDEFGREERIRSVLLLYGLHPLDLRSRVAEALEAAKPQLRSHGAQITLVEVSDSGAVSLRLEGTSNSHCSSGAAVQSLIEAILCDAAPDATEIAIDNAIRDSASPSFVPLESLRKGCKGDANESREIAASAANAEAARSAA